MGGGQVLVTGTPEQVANDAGSYTGQYLKKILARDKQRSRKRASLTADAKRG